MGDGAPDVVAVESPVEGDGFSEFLNEVCSLLSEAAFPHEGADETVKRAFGKWKTALIASVEGCLARGAENLLVPERSCGGIL